MAIPNTTFDTAIVIPSLPFAVTTTANDAGVTYSLWYAYTAPAPQVLSVFGYGTGTGYAPVTLISQLVGGFPDDLPDDLVTPSAQNRPVTFPVEAGETYFVKVQHSGAPATTANLTLDIVAHVAQAYPAESLMIPDDTWGFPGAVLSPTTGDVLTFVHDFDAGEFGDALTDGTILNESYTDSSLKLRDGQFALLTSIPEAALGAVGFSHIGEVVAWHGSTPKFYVGLTGNGPNPALIRTVSATGVVGTTWTLPNAGLTGLAVNQAETVAYVTGQGLGVIKRWDLVNHVMLSDFPLSGGTHVVATLTNDHLVVASIVSAPYNWVLREYDSAATLLHTYTLPLTTSVRMKPAADNPASMWVWVSNTSPPGTSTVFKLRLSDGAHLQEFTKAQFEGGAYQGAASATPSDRFGHSYSCPIFVVYQGSAEPEPEPSPHLEARYIRRLRRAPHIANEHKRVFYRSFELDLERGQALASGQGSDPVVLLRISRDGGQTWGEEIRMAVGRLGEYQARVLARRLGHSRDTVFEIVVSDPVAWSLVGAWLDLEAGTS